MQKRYRVTLSEEERAHLTDLTRRGTAPVRDVRRARALLLAARGKPDRQIAEAVGVHPRTIARLRERAATDGAIAACTDRPRPGGTPLLDSAAETILIATACSAPPHGHAQWSLRLLADRLVELAVVPSVSADTVRRTLKKTSSSRGSASSGAFPRSAPPS